MNVVHSVHVPVMTCKGGFESSHCQERSCAYSVNVLLVGQLHMLYALVHFHFTKKVKV